MNTQRRMAQSTMEYVIALTVIIAGIMAASGYLKSRIGGGVNTASDSIFNSLSGNPSLGNGSGNTVDPNKPPDPVGNPIATLCPTCSGPIFNGYTFDYVDAHKPADVKIKFDEIFGVMQTRYRDSPSNALYWTLSWLDDNNWIVLNDNRKPT